jgi:hypothetical protein
MSSLVEFTRRQTQIVASRVADSFSYCVILVGAGGQLLDADHLADARGLAAFFSDHATEVGPAEAFHRRAVR